MGAFCGGLLLRFYRARFEVTIDLLNLFVFTTGPATTNVPEDKQDDDYCK